MRERMIAIVQGYEHDRVPFVQYNNLAASNEEIWSVIGRENMGILQWCSIHKFEHPNCHFEREDFEKNGQLGYRRTLYTPEGKLFEEKLIEPNYGSAVVKTHFIKQPKDYLILLAYFRDITVHKNIEEWIKIYNLLGGDGLPHTSVGRTPYQRLWIEWVSLENLCLHLVDIPDIMEEVISVMTDVQHQIFKVVCEAACEVPLPYINFGDNITAPAIGQTYFRQFCLSAYSELADMLADIGKDIPISVHMDGELKPLWKEIGESKVRMIDSFSPPPDNDTSAADAISMWPEMRLGLNFPSSVHLAEPDMIYKKAMNILKQAGHSGRLQIQISENVPAGIWKKSFPEIVKAIEDFSKPNL